MTRMPGQTHLDGLDGFFAALVPGNGVTEFPKGVGRFLPKEAQLIFQIHYTPNGVEALDQPRLGIRFSKEQPLEPIVLNLSHYKTVGAKNSTVRTKQETETALFWSVTGPLSWNPLVRQVAKAAGRSVSENARLFALIAMATADAHIAVFDAKYAYNFWRPVTAIRNGNNDHNALTVATPDWLPLLDTPLHPEYPCAHCITASTVATILQAEFRDKTPPTLSMTSPTAPGVTRTWNNFAEYADEVSRARIYAGVHYRFSTRAGQRMGRAIAGFALQKLSLL